MVKPRVTIYSRQGCHLCEVVEEKVRRAQEEVEFDWAVVDIDADPELKARYGWEIPVVAIDGQDVFGHAMDYDAFVKRVRGR